MTGRTRKTPEQLIAGLERKLQLAKSRKKNLEQAQRTRRAVILGTTIQAMAESGDDDAKRAMTKVMAGLTRKQDRDVFGLPPLPDQAQPAGKPVPASVAEIDDRIRRAVTAWNDGEKTPQARAELVEAVIAMETVTRKVSTVFQPESRAAYGLGPGPAERLKAS